jgi:hypothetical protein
MENYLDKLRQVWEQPIPYVAERPSGMSGTELMKEIRCRLEWGVPYEGLMAEAILRALVALKRRGREYFEADLARLVERASEEAVLQYGEDVEVLKEVIDNNEKMANEFSFVYGMACMAGTTIGAAMEYVNEMPPGASEAFLRSVLDWHED